MSVEQIQSAVTAKVWQSIAQSGIDISGVERDDMDKLVRIVVDAALAEADTQLNDMSANEPLAAKFDGKTEKVLWKGRPFMSLVVWYVITNERIRIIHGLIGKDYEDIELVRVQDMDITQSIAERAMNIGDVIVTSHDASDPDATLRNVKNPREVHEILRRAVINARKEYGLRYREEM